MRRTVVLSVIALAMSAAGCSSAPAYDVVSRDENGNSRDLVIEVESSEDLEAVFDDVVGDLDDEAGYFVLINCSTGATSAADNRLANGRHAIGAMGEAATGLEDGQSDFSVNQDRSCPAPEAPTHPGGPTATQVVDAFAAAGLPVRNPRDNTAGCVEYGCAELITTDDISVTVYDDEQLAEAVAGEGYYQARFVVLGYAGARTPAELRPQYEAVLDDLG